MRTSLAGGQEDVPCDLVAAVAHKEACRRLVATIKDSLSTDSPGTPQAAAG